MKRIISVLMIVTCICATVFWKTTATALTERQALFVNRVGINLENGASNYNVYVDFTVTVADSERDILVECGDFVLINGTSVKSLAAANANITMGYKIINAVDSNKYLLVVTIPVNANILTNENDIITIKAGYTGNTVNYITTVDFKYKFGAVNSTDYLRIYRMDATEYETVELISLSAPAKSSGNMAIKLYMSKAVSSRKLVNLQFREKYHFTALGSQQFPMSSTEINLYYNYGMITTANEDSLLYKMQMGCGEFNGMADYDTKVIMTPKDTVDGIQLFTLEQIQRSVDGMRSDNQRPLVVQIHMLGNTIEFYLKGDSQAANYGGIDYNIAPDKNQDMIIRLKSGFMFPNGTMIKEDVTFKYEYLKGIWTNISDGAGNNTQYVDETLANQGGYTDAEIEELRKGVN